MPNLSKTLTVYEGADLTPARNRTDETVWEQTELGYYAQNGESAASTWAAHNDTGQTIFVRPHNYAKLVVGSNTIWTGRVAARNTERGETVTNPHRFHSTTMEDGNSHLRGIIVHNWERPQETDAARVQALVARYLSGNPRNSTNLNGSNFVVTGSNTITLPAQTYSGIEPFDVLQDIAEITDKTFFVSVDDELHYYGHDYTGYSSILRVSEDIADLNTVTCVPIDPSESEFSREIPTSLRTYWRNPDGGNERSWVDDNNTTKSQLDYWQMAYWDSESQNRTEAERASAQRFQAMDRGNFSHTLTIGAPGTLPQTVVNPQGQVGTAGQPMTGDDVWKVKPGQLIAYKSTVLRGADPAFFTRRIVGIRWTFPAADSYFATLELESLKPIGPRRRGGRDGGGGRRPTHAPEAPEQPADTVTEVACFRWTTNDSDETGTWGSNITRDPNVHTFSGGSFAANHGDLSNAGNETDNVPVTAGTTYRFSIGKFRWKWDPSTRGINVRWWDGGVLLQTDVFESGAGRAVNTIYSFEKNLTAPANADTVTFEFAHFNGGSIIDDMCIEAVDAGSEAETDEHAVEYDPDCPHDSPYTLPSDYIECRLDGLQDQISGTGSKIAGAKWLDLFAGHRFLIGAHGGDIGNNSDTGDSYPQNSLQAHRQAALKGADYADIDCRLTSDGVWVAWHDASITAGSNGTGDVSAITAATFTAAEYDSTSIPGYNASRHGTSISLVTVEDVVEACQPYGMAFQFECKPTDDASATSLAEFVVGHNLVGRCYIHVPTLSQAAAVKGVNANILVGADYTLSGATTDENVDIISIAHTTLTSLSVATAIAPKVPSSNMPISLYGIEDEAAHIQTVYDSGGRMWTSNDLDGALAVRGQIEAAGIGYWEPVTNGDSTTPEIVFSDGDIVMTWVTG